MQLKTVADANTDARRQRIRQLAGEIASEFVAGLGAALGRAPGESWRVAVGPWRYHLDHRPGAVLTVEHHGADGTVHTFEIGPLEDGRP